MINTRAPDEANKLNICPMMQHTHVPRGLLQYLLDLQVPVAEEFDGHVRTLVQRIETNRVDHGIPKENK